MERSDKMWQALVLLALLVIVLAYSLYPYISAFFGAFILYAVFKPIYSFMTSRLKIKPSIAAFSIIIMSILIILIPLYALLSVVFIQVQTLLEDINGIYSNIDSALNYIDHMSNNMLPMEIALRERLMDIAASVANSVSIMAVGAISTIGQRIIEFIIMYFVLFYLLVGDRSEFAQSLEKAIPFSEKNRNKLLGQFPRLVKTILVSSSIIAILQGFILMVTFLLLDIKGAFLWGFVTMILAFLPVVGPPIIWVPTLAFQIIQGDMFTAAGVLAGGIIHTLVDEVLRPFVQKRVGHVHPLVTLVGVVTGVKFFGLLGIIIGPLLISYVLLVAAMFHDEYLTGQEDGQYREISTEIVEDGLA
ncbi:AI-2E family transporter [Methanolobus chelungpuianus]|uniref:Permease n=1 Tax=Methanolobus chelungpuianus TaxID=502115 RepID=A0AAE3HBQ2_9EURY|nr:AI-2E family transporter [Methanolobus chelungpuianus]MCQ6963252.1 permease [Methanolobus chelungpuianus]